MDAIACTTDAAPKSRIVIQIIIKHRLFTFF
jgi:hypothetical protein